MERQLTEKQELERNHLAYWWEDLDDAMRDKLMAKFEHGWKGSEYERFVKLKKMYAEFKRLNKEGKFFSSQP